MPSAILSHEPKIAEATLVSSPPRSPPSDGFYLATTTPKWHVVLDRMFEMFSICRCCSCLLTGGFCDRLSVLPDLAERHYPVTFAECFSHGVVFLGEIPPASYMSFRILFSLYLLL